jgi:3-isopropylmalate/(R)-2-methylmalate dehydratase small subunit
MLEEDAVRAIASQVEADPERNLVTVDLPRQVVVAPDGGETAFGIDKLRRAALLDGLDDIGLTRKHEAEIVGFQARDRARRPWIYAVERP